MYLFILQQTENHLEILIKQGLDFSPRSQGTYEYNSLGIRFKTILFKYIVVALQYYLAVIFQKYIDVIDIDKIRKIDNLFIVFRDCGYNL